MRRHAPQRLAPMMELRWGCVFRHTRHRKQFLCQRLDTAVLTVAHGQHWGRIELSHRTLRAHAATDRRMLNAIELFSHK